MIEQVAAVPEPVRVQVPPAIASPLPGAAPQVVVDATILIAATSVAVVRRLVVTNATVVAALATRVPTAVDATVTVETAARFKVVE